MAKGLDTGRVPPPGARGPASVFAGRGTCCCHGLADAASGPSSGRSEAARGPPGGRSASRESAGPVPAPPGGRWLPQFEARPARQGGIFISLRHRRMNVQ